jgi:peptidyl-prolyl cis-trans isomerase B (cyclophilin B)
MTPDLAGNQCERVRGMSGWPQPQQRPPPPPPPGYGQQGPWPGYGGYPPPPAPSNNVALAALICALVAPVVAVLSEPTGERVLVAVGAVLWIVGLILAFAGLSRAGRLGGAGRGMAVTALILCLLPILFLVLGVFLYSAALGGLRGG